MAAMNLQPIGIIHTPFKEASGTPLNPKFAKGVQGTVEVFEKFAAGLKVGSVGRVSHTRGDVNCLSFRTTYATFADTPLLYFVRTSAHPSAVRAPSVGEA